MGGLFGGDVPTPQPIPMPEAPKATPMQDPAAAAAAARKARAKRQSKGGTDLTSKSSTILSSYGDSDSLGA